MTHIEGDLHTDTEIKASVMAELARVPGIDSNHIGVAADRGSVTLTGEVDSYPQKVLAGQATLRVPGVTALALDLCVRDIWCKITDTDIAVQASLALRAAVNIPVTVQVTVNDHAITLTGEVSDHHEKVAAEHAVRHLKGVTEVLNEISIKPNPAFAAVKGELEAAIARHAQFEGSSITVRSNDLGHIWLGGHVPSLADRHSAEELAWSAPGITGLTNSIQVCYDA